MSISGDLLAKFLQLAKAVRSGNHSIFDSSWQFLRPVRNSLHGDPNGCGSLRSAAEQLDSDLLVHDGMKACFHA